MQPNVSIWVLVLAVVAATGALGSLFLPTDQASIVSAVLPTLAEKSKTENPVLKCLAADKTLVTKVIDGDTVVVSGGEHVRLLGIDADEKGYPCYDAARLRLEALTLNRQVILEKDVSDVDRYGRCLRSIFTNGSNVGLQLVQEGLVVARFYEPDVTYRLSISNAEQLAQQQGIGCKWALKK